MEKKELGQCCANCDWHDTYTWVCCNGESSHRADFTEPDCTCHAYQPKREEDSITKEENHEFKTQTALLQRFERAD